jgi:hypothetical protein
MRNKEERLAVFSLLTVKKAVFSAVFFALVFLGGCDIGKANFGAFVDEQLNHLRTTPRGAEDGTHIITFWLSDSTLDTSPIYGDIEGTTITVILPVGTVLGIFTASFITSEGTTSIPFDFRGGASLVFTVTSGGKTVEYTASIVLSSAIVRLNGTATYATLADAIDAATEGTLAEPDVITILQSISDSAKTGTINGIVISGGRHIKLVPNSDSNKTIKRWSGYDGSLFTVESGSSLTLEGSGGKTLAIDGQNLSALSALVTVDGTLTLKDGASLQNNDSSSGPDAVGGGVTVDTGTFNVEGGTISGNTGGAAGAVFANNGTFNMSGGTISNNTGTRSRDNAGGVYTNNGTINMTGGTINGNTSSNSGAGGVWVNDNGTFAMSGGAVVNQDNDVCLANGKTITINDNLTASPAAKITPSDYTEGNQVLDGTADLISGNYEKFTVTPGGSPGAVWFVVGTGRIYKTSSVVVRGTINTYASLSDAISAVSTGTAGSPDEITILQDIDSSAKMSVSGGITITNKLVKLTTPPGTTRTIKRWTGNTGSLFTVSSGSLTLEGGGTSGALIIDGGKDSGLTATAALIMVNSGGTLNVYDGGIIRDNRNTNSSSSSWGGGIKNNGTINMYGGEISGNSVPAPDSRGGGVLNNKTFNISGGTISGNSAEYGGGVSNEPYNTQAEFTMSDGTISGNTATNSGGGVYVFMNGMSGSTNSSTFTMSGGNITGNTANSGGGVYRATSGVIYNAHGGSITGNTPNEVAP